MSGADDPLPHDAWLTEALRHAPDADAVPSAKLDAAVLRMGRAAVAPRVPRSAPPPPSWLDSLAAVLSWLARPPVAAGFASVMVAGVVGLMWWDRPLDEAMPPREVPVAVAPESSTAAPAEPATVAAAPPAVPPAPAPAPAQAVTPARKAAPAPTAEQQRDTSHLARSIDAGRATPAPAPAAPAVATAPAPAPERSAEAAERRALTSAAPTSREVQAAAGRQAAPAAPAPLADTEPPVAALAMRGAASGPIETPGLSNLRFEIRRRPEGWTWQRDAGEPRAVDDAVQAWIAQADRTARTSWQPAAADNAAATTTLRFLRDGQTRALLRIRASGLRLERSGKAEAAELRADQVSALLGGLDALGP